MVCAETSNGDARDEPVLSSKNAVCYAVTFLLRLVTDSKTAISSMNMRVVTDMSSVESGSVKEITPSDVRPVVAISKGMPTRKGRKSALADREIL